MGEGDGTITVTNADIDWAPPVQNDVPRPFDVICANLTALGALSIDDFLNDFNSSQNSKLSAVNFDANFYVQLPEILSSEGSFEKDKDKETKSLKVKPEDSENGIKAARNAVSLLRQTCQSMFGSSEPLKYEFLEDSVNTRECILTITRPNGAMRSYTSGSASVSRADVKGMAAQRAVELGAVDFITSGDSDALKAKQGLLLNPLEVVDVDNESSTAVSGSGRVKLSNGDEAITEIVDCCTEWRAGKVKPCWFAFTDTRSKKKHGAALRISLDQHVFRSYSIEAIHDTPRQAKIACAKVAIKEGVKEFIMHGNGQTEPMPVADDDLDLDSGTPPPTKTMNLQEYFDTLPQPFPEDIGNVSAVEINAPGWINTALQSARGGRLTSYYQPLLDSGRQLHGYILRIERPNESQTYIIDPQFPKRGDARSAVCLLAMSQGIGDYIRSIRDDIENKLSPEMRKLANEKLFQVISAECGKIRHGNRSIYLYTTDRDAFGCTLKVDISPDESQADIRVYKVDTEYRTKIDAKAAVACLAAEQGLIDVLRFRGGPLPADYTPFWEAQVNGDGDHYVHKRRNVGTEVVSHGRDNKKRKKGNNDVEGGEIIAPSFRPDPVKKKIKLPETEGHPLPAKPVILPPISMRPTGSVNVNSWKKPPVTGSRGLAPTNARVPLPRSLGQDRSGNRNGGIPYHDNDKYDRSRYDTVDVPGSSMTAYSNPTYLPYNDRTSYQEESSYYPPSHSHVYPPSPEAYHHLPPPESYPQPHHDSYGPGYPPYSPPAPLPTGHYPATPYHSPPSSNLFQPPLQHDSGYYQVPSTQPPIHHTPYGHYYPNPYSHPPLQPYSYPHSPYHHPPAYAAPSIVYSPTAPVPLTPPHVTHTDPYGSGYHSPYPASPPHSLPRSPPALPHRHPMRLPHHTHHSIEYTSVEPTRQFDVNGGHNHRRHNTMADSPTNSRHRVNGYHRNSQQPALPEDVPENEQSRNDEHSPPPRYRDPLTGEWCTWINTQISNQEEPTTGIAQQAVDDSPVNRRTGKLPSQEIDLPLTAVITKPDEQAEPRTPETVSPPEIVSPLFVEEPKQEKPVKKTSQPASSKTSLSILYEFCEKQNTPKPAFYHQVIPKDDRSGEEYVVWAETDSQRLQLPNRFSSIQEGYEQLSKKILQWERLKLLPRKKRLQT